MTRNSKLEELRNQGWSQSDITNLFEEILDKCFENQSIHRKSIIKSKLKELGFSYAYDGTKMIEEFLMDTIEKDEDLRKEELYKLLLTRTNIKKENVRYKIRKVIYIAFKNPTPLAQEVFRNSIEKRGYPTVSELAAELYHYFK